MVKKGVKLAKLRYVICLEYQPWINYHCSDTAFFGSQKKSKFAGQLKIMSHDLRCCRKARVKMPKTKVWYFILPFGMRILWAHERRTGRCHLEEGCGFLKDAIRPTRRGHRPILPTKKCPIKSDLGSIKKFAQILFVSLRCFRAWKNNHQMYWMIVGRKRVFEIFHPSKLYVHHPSCTSGFFVWQDFLGLCPFVL